MTKVWRDFISCHPKPLFNSPCLEVGCWQNIYDTVASWNPAPVGMVNFPLFTGFYRSQVVQDFFHQQYHPQFMIVLSKLETTTIFCRFLSSNLWNAWNVFRSMLIHLLDDHGFLGSLGSSRLCMMSLIQLTILCSFNGALWVLRVFQPKKIWYHTICTYV